MITFDPKYIFTATQSTVIIYFVIILFNIIFWIVDSVRGNAPSPEHASPPLLTVLVGLLLGFLVALPITFASYALLLPSRRRKFLGGEEGGSGPPCSIHICLS